jgi:polar amino acid transport system substrate-binding protein
VDVILEDKNVIEYYFASHELPMTIRPIGNPVDINNYEDTYVFVAFGPNKPKAKEYADLLTNGMKEMRASGELKAILANYNVDSSYRFVGAKGDKPHP